MTTNNADRERAQRLLRHYFRMIAEAAGVRWDSDNDGEVGDIADHLIAAAVAEMRDAQPAPALVQPSMFPSGEDAPLFTLWPDGGQPCSKCNRHPSESGLAEWRKCDACGAPVCETCAYQERDGVFCSTNCVLSATEYGN